jgi:sec-independent protein translocase protein TatA
MPLHWSDLLIIVVLGLIFFGPKRLPEIGSALGKTIREFQKSIREVTNPEPPTSLTPSAAQSMQPPMTPTSVAEAQSAAAPSVADDERVEEDAAL